MIGGVPMIIRVAKNAEKLNLGRVVVGTDSIEILNVCRSNKVEVLMTQKTHKSGTDRVYEVYNSLNENFDLVINLQGDLPFFTKQLFESLIELFVDDKVDIGSAICNLDNNELDDPNIVKAKVNLDERNQGFALDFTRVAKVKDNLYHHIGIYIYKPDVLKKFINLKQSKKEKDRSLEQMRALENNFTIKLVKICYNPPSVDTASDLQKIRLHFKKNDL